MPLKIYYLDDETDLLELFVDSFSAPDRIITTFSVPEIAMNKILQDPPDILFIDFRLPGTTGDVIASKLDANIPKVLITGELELQPKSTFADIVRKPFSAADVEAIIEKLSKSRKAA